MTSALSQARLGLLYHCVWDKTVADETFVRWQREDFVEYGAIAEAIYTYDQRPNPETSGPGRVLGISGVLHEWIAAEEQWRRHHRQWRLDPEHGAEPHHPYAVTVPSRVVEGGPIFEFRRLAGATVREGRFAHVVAPQAAWVPRVPPEQLHKVLEVDADRRTAVADRTRSKQLAAGDREAAEVQAADRGINWAPIEAGIRHRAATAAQAQVGA